MSRVLGETTTGDVAPVLANRPRMDYAERLRRLRSRRGEDPETGNVDVKRMVGESDSEDDSVIPDDAEPVDPSEMSDGKPLRPVRDIVQEPSHPVADKEKYQTPYAALTAPDVTPQSTQPIDPSNVPGTTTPERFTAADLAQSGGNDTSDVAAKAMDVLLGRNRASKPATTPADFSRAGDITTEEAARLVGVQPPVFEDAKAKAAAVLQEGGAMPPPAPASDGSAVYSAFRRFNG